MRNAFGNVFRIALSGESHSPVMSVEIAGVPEGIPLGPVDFAEDIDRRRPGRKGTTARIEKDIPEIVRGVKDGHTTGTTLKILFRNENTDPSAYQQFADIPRPGHADWVRRVKYGAGSLTSGGGMFSGRMTLPVVAAGVVAKKIIAPMQVHARLTEVGGLLLTGKDGDNAALDAMLSEVAVEGDSVGGVVECVCDGVPAGLGEPFFYPIEAALSQMVFSIPGIRGIEFGDGFKAARMRGSQHNDPIVDTEGHTSRNGAGGINGGITNGNPLVFRVAVKPSSSIAGAQKTMNLATGRMEELEIKGRHDVCFALRVPVVIESAAAIALCDALLSDISKKR
ncbi:MAG TPA: chorismate synthase [Candidatus Coprenecus stercoravium]|uniref:Chorismate synthase n=1 Tax=Candidatus Coprenecus stercoravium TaxID=2840735 RepID=A0A9D2K911_9BACT|nr:chorismate synthase [Candidatus Coprenecus stercoravium]